MPMAVMPEACVSRIVASASQLRFELRGCPSQRCSRRRNAAFAARQPITVSKPLNGAPPENQAAQDELLQVLLADYDRAAEAYTLSCTITHSRFTAFAALMGALLVGLWAVSGFEHVAAIHRLLAFLGLGISLAWTISTIRDQVYVERRVRYGVAVERDLQHLLSATVQSDRGTLAKRPGFFTGLDRVVEPVSFMRREPLRSVWFMFSIYLDVLLAAAVCGGWTVLTVMVVQGRLE